MVLESFEVEESQKGAMFRKRRGSNGWEDSLRPRPAQTQTYQSIFIPRFRRLSNKEFISKKSKKVKYPVKRPLQVASNDLKETVKKIKLQENYKQINGFNELIENGVDSPNSNVTNLTEMNPNLEACVGEFVWAKLGNQRWWPAMVVWGSDCGQNPARLGHTWVFWYGDHKVSEVPRDKICDFIDGYKNKTHDNSGKLFKQAVLEAIYDCAVRAHMDFSSDDSKSLLEWADDDFRSDKHQSEAFKPDANQPLSDLVTGELNKVKDQTSYNFSFNYNLISPPQRTYEPEEREAIQFVKDETVKLEDICLACARPGIKLVTQHPLFEGGLCKGCKVDLMETLFAYGEDGTNLYCVVCCNAGELLICDNNDCNRVYCTNCFDILIGPDAYKEALKQEPWLCYICSDEKPKKGSLLRKRPDWQQNIVQLFQPENTLQAVNPEDFKEKRPMRVLSLFDGIGTGEMLRGKFVLDQLGIEVECYYSTEIDMDAINVTRVQHKDKIIQLGRIENITDAQIGKLCPIDLVIGGSPCNDLSLVNPARKGLYDPSGTGRLFFDFFRVLKAVQLANHPRHLFWLFENVASMPQEFKSTITRFFQCEPALWDSKYFSAQNRARYFWGNIPGMYCPMNPNLLQNTFTLDSVLTPHCNRKAVVEKIRTVTTRSNSLKQGKKLIMPVIMDGEGDVLWITELERVFGFPDHYTDAGNIALGRRQQLLGKSWSVSVIKHLFTPLRNFFKTINSNSSSSSLASTSSSPL